MTALLGRLCYSIILYGVIVLTRLAASGYPLHFIKKTGNKVLKTNNRIKLIVLSVSMLASLGSFATDNSANQNGNQVAAADARQPIQQTGGQYEVRPGETLNQIAARVRPNNMSLSETAKAIIQANPDIFKNGNPNLIFAGDVLRIPTGSQISGTAPTPPAQTQPQQPAPAVTPKSAENVTGQTVKPEGDGKQASAKTDSKSNTANNNITSESKADNTAASTVPSTVAPKAATASSQEAAATASPASQSSGGSSLPWILVGGIGLAALLFLNKFRGNKQTNKENATASPALKADKAPVSGKTTAAAVTTAAVAEKNAASDDIETSDDDFTETEDIFFSDVDPRAEEPTATDDFNLDLSTIGNQQGIVSSSITTDEETLKRADADWDNIESTESVYEDDVSPATFKKTAIDEETVKTPAAVEESVVEVVEFTEPEAIDESEEEVLEFDAASTVIEAPNPVASQPVVEESIEAEPASETVIEIEQEVESTTDEDSPLEFEPVSVEPVIPEAVVEQTTEQESSENVETVTALTDTATEEPATHNWALETAEEPAETLEAKTQTAETTEEEPVPYSWATEKEAADDKAEELEADSDFDTFEALQDTQEENFSAAPIAITEASDDDVIEWDSVDFASDDKEVGFISESVGMTAPLEAKYELAQMYIEIGDPDAARETLSELVEEASGDILEKSKALLAEIG